MVSGEHCVWVELSLAVHGGHVASFVQETHSDIPERRSSGVRSIFSPLSHKPGAGTAILGAEVTACPRNWLG